MDSLNSQNKKNTSKMKKLRNHCQLKEQEYSSEGANNETNLCSLTANSKKELVKILKELIAYMTSNADSFRNELENIRRSQEKLENSFVEM